MNLFVEFYLVISICSLAAGFAVYLNTFNKKLKNHTGHLQDTFLEPLQLLMRQYFIKK